MPRLLVRMLVVRMLVLRPGKLCVLRDDAKGSNRTKFGEY
jgi:hypothetical protein